jgi:hypothetical protein
MTKGKLFNVFLILLLSISTTSFAQFNIGGGFMFDNYKTDLYKKMHSGLQFKIGYDFNHALGFINAGFNYSNATGRTFFTYPNTTSDGFYYSLNRKFNNAFLHFGCRLFNPGSDFNIRLFGGSSVDFINQSWTFGDSLSKSFKSQLADTTMIGYKIDLGATVEFKLGKGMLFTEYVIGLPANKINDQPYDNPTYGHKGIIIGYLFCFENKRNYR